MDRRGQIRLVTARRGALIGLAVLACALRPSAPPTGNPESATDRHQSRRRGSDRKTPPPPRRFTARSDQTAQESPTGLVIDSDGSAVAGATVAIVGDGRVATTDELGAFRFTPSPSAGDRLRVSGPGLADAEVRWQIGDATPHILVPRAESITAMVVEEGRASPGAVVYLVDGSHLAPAEAIADEGGHVTFSGLAPGTYQLWAAAGDRVTPLARTLSTSGSGNPVELALAPGTAVSGQVVDSHGDGVEATVTLLPLDQDHAARRVTTNASGLLEVRALPRGRWRVLVESPGTADAELELRAGRAEESLAVTLRPGATVSGIVVDEDGRPVSGASLVLRSSRQSPVRAATALPSAALGARWVHPLAGERHLPLRDSRRFGAARDGLRPMECGRGHCGVDVGGQRGSTVHAAASGTVVTVAFDPVGRAGRYVAVEHVAGLKSFYMHLDEVRADLQVGDLVLAGEAIGTLGASGIQRSEPHLHFALARTDGGRPVFVDPEPLLQRAVVLAGEAPLESRERRLGWLAEPVSELAAESNADEAITSDTHGRFVFLGVAAGKYRILARASDRVPTASNELYVAASTPLGGVELRLPRGGAVEGHVLGPDGPIAGAHVTAWQDDDVLAVAESRTDAYGYYRLQRVSGTVTIAATAPGFGRQSAPVSGISASRPRTLDLQLSALRARLVGTVLGPNGLPVAGAKVQVVEGPSGAGRSTVTDGDGNFAIDQVAEGRYALRVVASGYPRLAAEANTEARSELSLELGGELSLRVVDQHTGSPIPGLSVAVRRSGETLRAQSDAGGQLSLLGIRPGSWRVSIAHAGYVALERQLKITADRQEQTSELQRGASLAGVVRDHWGERVAGALVSVGASKTRTDADGRFRLTDVPTGAIEIRSETDSASGHEPLTLSPGDEFVTLELRLDAPDE